jgi:flagellar biosynthetic protein FliP
MGHLVRRLALFCLFFSLTADLWAATAETSNVRPHPAASQERAERLGSLLRETEARDAGRKKTDGARRSSTPQDADDLRITFQGEDGKNTTVSSPIKVFVMLTLLSLAPALLMMMTAFTRIVIVMGFVRHALSTQQIPPNIVLIGLSLFLTMFVMTPTFSRMNENALQPYLEDKIGHREAFEEGLVPLREFMGKQTRKDDLALFLKLAKVEDPKSFDDVPTTALVPAFVVSELRTAFQMGFLIFLPFLVIDLVVASVLMSLGMVMLPPAMISLPLKVLLFVLADGWNLLVKSLVLSFG